jgi:spore maturation protein CgeB
MKIVLFYHSLVSDWNHGNAHFLRGVVTELMARSHHVEVYEPSDGWSRRNLIEYEGAGALDDFTAAYPHLRSTTYDLDTLELDVALDSADVVIVHEWNDAELVARIGDHHARHGRYVLLFHDTHHRCVTAPEEIREYRLEAYDGVLAFGEVIRQRYLRLGWAQRAFTWHEAADTTVFFPHAAESEPADVAWIGNWGDDERSQELLDFLVGPVGSLGLSGTAYGVRYPQHALLMLAEHGFDYRGWLPNHDVPRVFAGHRATVHVPRRPYVEALPGVPTIRVFEALACGIPLICAPWWDEEGLFRPGTDYLLARDGSQMRRHLRAVLGDRDHAAALARSGLETITSRHTCRHRVDELLQIVARLDRESASPAPTRTTPEARA